MRCWDRGIHHPLPVLIASTPEDTPGPSTAVDDLEEEEEEESQPEPVKRKREDELLQLIKEDMRLQREDRQALLST